MSIILKMALQNKSKWFVIVPIAFLAGCQTYQNKEFIPHNIYAEIETGRVQTAENNQLSTQMTFVKSAELMSVNNLDLELLKVEYQKYRALADIGTLLANPSVEVGPKFLDKELSADASKIVPFVSFGFAIPLSNRIGKENDVKKLEAALALQKLVVGHRNLYFELRRIYAETLSTKEYCDIMQDVEKMATIASSLTTKLEKTGQVAALDVYEGQAEAVRSSVAKFDAQKDLIEKYTELAEMIGCNSQIWNKETNFEKLPELDLEKMEEQKIVNVLIKNNPQLVLLETERLIADANYKLQIVKQIPDLNIGLGIDRTENRETEFPLGFGIDIPIFDRNQQAIAEAKSERDLVDLRYKRAMISAINSVSKLQQQYVLTNAKLSLITTNLLPKSKKSLTMAEKGVRNGVFSALQWLKFQRDYRELLVEAAQLTKEKWLIVMELEQALGIPLVKLSKDENWSIFDFAKEEQEIETREEVKE